MLELTILQTTRGFAERIDQSPCNGCHEFSASFTAGLRPGAETAVRALKAAGMKVELLSGDAEAPVRDLADRLGIPDWQAGVLPTEKAARGMVEEHGRFVEVFVATSVEECARRDVKGLYEKAFSGEIKEFTGVSDPYEEPSDPELRIDTEKHPPEESARIVIDKLEQLDLVRSEVAA